MTRRSWVVLLVALVAAGLCARLGLWQLDRAQQKNALQAARDDLERLPPLDAASLASDPLAAEAQINRRIVLPGAWMHDATVYLENRTMGGRTGFFVVTPLVLDDGRAVAVQRGWLPRDARDRERIAPYRTDAGRVVVGGRVAPSPSRLYQLGPAASGPIRQNLDLAEYVRAVRRPLVPVVIVQDDTEATRGDGLARRWPQPAADVHKNYGYAFQWFGLSALVITLYAWFQVIRPRRRSARRRAAHDGV